MVRFLCGAIVILGLQLAGVGTARAAAGLKVGRGELCVLVGEKAGNVETRAARLLAEEVRRRTGIEVPVGGTVAAKYALVIGTPESSAAIAAYWKRQAASNRLGPDGFHLLTTADGAGRMYLVGQSPVGIVAGTGKLLRLACYADGSLTIAPVALTDAPRLPVRGIYFATHFGNFYHAAPLHEVDRVIEDCALWGGNQLLVWFDMHHFKSFQDPAAQAHLARLKHFGETAQGVGMKFGAGFLANEAYSTSPPELRADRNTGRAHYGVELCPSKPQGLELIGRWQAEVLDAFPALDFTWTWPYDQGGCACPDCKPWGAKGYLRASEQLAGLFHRRFPCGEFWLSTWLFDFQRDEGEYNGLFRYIRQERPDWLTGILAGTHGDWIPKPLVERPFPARYPLTCFPEISMYQMSPWGGCGANPLPDYCTRLAARLRGQIVGGWPYSEGIYEDLNKFFWAQCYWCPGRPTDDVLAEYAAFYLGPESVADAVRLFHLMEKTHSRRDWQVRNLNEADEAWALTQAIDRRLAPWAKRSWRWRILYIRAAIDHVLKTQDALHPEAQAALKPLCDELVRIYHAEATFIRPPAFPQRPSPQTVLRGVGCPITASSTHPKYAGSERRLVDGILSADDPDNFWVSDPAKEKTARLLIDLGKPMPIKEVRLQFRGIHGAYWFIPSTIGVDVSEDGKAFASVVCPTAVPKEGTPYSHHPWTCAVGKPARYVRVNLGPSQHTSPPFAGTLELTEIQVFSP